MAYGGAGPVGGSGSASTIKQVKLERESELRIEVGNDAPLRLRLLNGTAEIFGTELPPEIWLNFPPRLKFAVNSFITALLFFFFFLFPLSPYPLIIQPTLYLPTALLLHLHACSFFFL